MTKKTCPIWKAYDGPNRARYEAWLRSRYKVKSLIFVLDSASPEMKAIATANNRNQEIAALAKIREEDEARQRDFETRRSTSRGGGGGI